jgi:hypothetical protein
MRTAAVDVGQLVFGARGGSVGAIQIVTDASEFLDQCVRGQVL